MKPKVRLERIMAGKIIGLIDTADKMTARLKFGLVELKQIRGAAWKIVEECDDRLKES